jgi:hypothetical protein
MNQLLTLNVNDHTEKKGGLTYLSWAWAWAEALKADPKARYEVRRFGPVHNQQPLCMIGETAMVCVEVTLGGVSRECWLPVMDNRNKAIKNPDAFAVNTSIMRCMTKALSLHGLGLYIYAGEDLPEGEESAEKPVAAAPAPAVVKSSRITPTDGAGEGLSNEVRTKCEEIALYLIDAHKNGADLDAIRVYYDPTTFEDNDERVYVWKLLASESKLRSTIKNNKPMKEAA